MRTKRATEWVLVVAAIVLLGSDAAQAFYNPQTGRWLSRDPAAEAGDNNLYSGLHNRPTSAVDYLGRFTVEFAWKGLQFVHIPRTSGYGRPTERLWAAFILRPESSDALTYSGGGEVLMRSVLSYSIGTCCASGNFDNLSTAASATRFFTTQFQFVPGTSSLMLGTDATGQTIVPVEPSENSPPDKTTEVLWFNPINFDVHDLLGRTGGKVPIAYQGTIGSIQLTWDYMVLPAGGVGPMQFQTLTSPDMLFEIDSLHMYSSGQQPSEWSSGSSHPTSISLSFSWDSCGRSSKPYGTAFVNSPKLPASGLSRVQRWDDVNQYSANSEYWVAP